MAIAYRLRVFGAKSLLRKALLKQPRAASLLFCTRSVLTFQKTEPAFHEPIQRKQSTGDLREIPMVHKPVEKIKTFFSRIGRMIPSVLSLKKKKEKEDSRKTENIFIYMVFMEWYSSNSTTLHIEIVIGIRQMYFSEYVKTIPIILQGPRLYVLW